MFSPPFQSQSAGSAYRCQPGSGLVSVGIASQDLTRQSQQSCRDGIDKDQLSFIMSFHRPLSVSIVLEHHIFTLQS